MSESRATAAREDRLQEAEPAGALDKGEATLRLAPRQARPRDVRGVGFPSPREPLYGGRTLNALSRKVEVPFPTVEAETRERVEQFIGCTLEQSYSEFTMELKNSVSKMLDDINRIDQSRPARHRRASQRNRTVTNYFR